MKKLLMAATALCCLWIMGLTLASCESDSVGEYRYTVGPSDDTSVQAYTSYRMTGQDIVLAEVTKIGKLVTGTTFQLTGSLTDCNEKIKEAVNTGMNKVEASPTYNHELSATTIIIENITEQKVIFSRKFK